MAENLAETIQKALQDLVAPDVRELKVLVVALQKQIDGLQTQMDHRFEAADKQMDHRFEAADKKSDLQFKAIMAALGEFKAQSELANMRVIATLSERVAVLEARQQ